jgi:IS605 OrfB family transposase
MKRAILLQTSATQNKKKRLADFMGKALREYNRLLSAKWNPETCDWIDTFMDFHHKTLSVSKINTSFNVQVRCSLIRDAWKKKSQKADGLTVKFNVPRNCKTFSTKANFFVELGMYPRRRVAVPIRQNRNYQRFASLIAGGWMCKTYGLTSHGQIVAFLNKEKKIISRKNMLGIDVNARQFAVSVVSPDGKVLYQTYFGRHIWAKRKKLMDRRAMLQTLKAGKKLKHLGKAETDFVKTNLGQMVREIVGITKRFDADIAVERLERFRTKGRNFNRKVMRIPFYRFRSILEQRCFDHDIHLKEVGSQNTSRWCSHCGALGNGHESSNYSLFRCKACGQEVNSDRKASLSIAVKTLLERNRHISNPDCSFQFSSRRVPVNGLLCSDEVGLKCAVHSIQPSDGKPTRFSGG